MLVLNSAYLVVRMYRKYSEQMKTVGRESQAAATTTDDEDDDEEEDDALSGSSQMPTAAAFGGSGGTHAPGTVNEGQSLPTWEQVCVLFDVSLIVLTAIRERLAQAEHARLRQIMYRRVSLVVRECHRRIGGVEHVATLNAVYALAALIPDSQCAYTSKSVMRCVLDGGMRRVSIGGDVIERGVHDAVLLATGAWKLDDLLDTVKRWLTASADGLQADVQSSIHDDGGTDTIKKVFNYVVF
jgi:hypothetical protein